MIGNNWARLWVGKVWVEFQATISIFIELNSHLQAFLSTVPFQTLIILSVVRRKKYSGVIPFYNGFFFFLFIM